MPAYGYLETISQAILYGSGTEKIAFQYINVTKDPAGMKQMLQYSKGGRTVPVIVEGSKVTIGFDGGG